MTWWQLLLFPFTLLNDLITRIRNAMYDQEVYKPITFDTNVIVVGNLSAGGTGKTPFVSYLVNHFQSIHFQPSVLSRGYKRSTGGFRQAKLSDTASEIGDEPKMLQLKHPIAGIFVGSQRDLAIPELLYYRQDTKVVLLDDGYQHRIVEPNLKILLTTFQDPFYDDYLLPTGKLRESKKGAKRANIIIVTKCPSELPEGEMSRIKSEIEVYSDASVFFTTIEYLQPRPIFNDSYPFYNQVVGISGIAKPQLFEEYLSKNYQCKIVHHFSDHYRYKSLDAQHIINELAEDVSLLTTEKDMVKLREFKELSEYSCYYLPMEVKFIKDEALFLSMVHQNLKKDVFEQDPL